MRKPPAWMIFGFCLLLATACSHTRTEKVQMPPRMDLKSCGTIGMIDFSSNAEDDLQQYLTQEYLQRIYDAQPGVRILELGSSDALLDSLQRNRLDPETIRLIGQTYNVDAVVFGSLQLSEIKPSVNFTSVMDAVSAKVYVEGILNARVQETQSGATIWSNLTRGKKPVAGLHFNSSGPVSFGASDPKEKYGELVEGLVYANTDDFRPYYEYREIPKD